MSFTPNKSSVAECADELSLSTLTGGYDKFNDILNFNPVQIIFDNQDTSKSVEISKNGTSTWKTFEAGEALVLDMRGNHGQADNFTFPRGTQFYGRGTAGAVTFKISYTYAEQL